MEGSGGCNGGGGRDVIDGGGDGGGLCGLVRSSLGYRTSHISTTLIRFDVPQHPVVMGDPGVGQRSRTLANRSP